jgi:hypothetical protein
MGSADMARFRGRARLDQRNLTIRKNDGAEKLSDTRQLVTRTDSRLRPTGLYRHGGSNR